ncbi:odorant receptor 131-2-like [Hypomesus transpacificus]|uniref:odorant receptor 131-2-like n=1 Tax=Hypomesus transpacificus TaxID=137520 RepID=UPI001F0830FB|nr:odorant receptor 131-2-like [Hypomesus transpacificus]
MNFSAGESNVTVVLMQRDTFETALIKNIIVVALSLSINYINSMLVHTFTKHQVFKTNPRYILFIHLVVNDMLQLTLACLLHVLSYILFTLNVSFCCFLLVTAIFTTFNTPVNLATMAIERYIAVCIPLRHAQICTVQRTYITISLIWVLTALPILPDVFILVANEPLSFFSSRIFCHLENLFRNPFIIERNNTSLYVFLALVWLTLLYTYLSIMFAARAASGDARKARNTILLHGLQLLLCTFTYVHSLLQSRLLQIFPTKLLDIRFASYVIVQIIPRFISPIVYGLRDQTFRKHLKGYLLCRVNASTYPNNDTLFKISGREKILL